MDTQKKNRARVHITNADLNFYGFRTVEEFTGEPPEWIVEAIANARAWTAAQSARRRANGDSAEGRVRK